MQSQKVKVIIGTRGSRLALTQAERIRNDLGKFHPGVKFSLRIIKSTGDRNRKVPLQKAGGVGFFVRELENALLRGEIDLAVHSLKDLPVEVPSGLVLGAVTKREIPYDALVSNDKVKFNDLPFGATVATGSLRRKFFLKYLRPDLKVVHIRGNLDTRLKKLFRENLDAIVVAACGLYRIGQEDSIKEIFPASMILPPAGQGCLGIEIRERDEIIKKLIALLNHPASWQETMAERRCVNQLGGGCHLPLGVLARADGEVLHIEGAMFTNREKNLIKASISGNITQAESLGKELANKILRMRDEEE